MPDGRTERPAGGAAGGAAGAGSRPAPCRAVPEPRTAGNPAVSGQNPEDGGSNGREEFGKVTLSPHVLGEGFPAPASFLRVSPPGEVSTLNSRSCMACNLSGG